MSEIILHHYSTSPFSEKVRIGLGLKNLAWRSVNIPVIMPKPDLMPLTGGYRKTPVMQIGADIYCDTQCILREIERRYPEPSFWPDGTKGVADAVAFWADRLVFWPAVSAGLAAIADQLPQAFKDDRATFSGRDFNPEKIKQGMPVVLDQLRAALGWTEAMLADGRPWLLGTKPSLADLAVYHCVWFVRRNLGSSAAPLAPYARIKAWADRVAEIGHGRPTEMSAKEALEVAKAAAPATPAREDAGDPVGRKPGAKVTVTPDDTGRDPVTGELVASSEQEVVIRRSDPAVGEVMVHFPRAGVMVLPA